MDIQPDQQNLGAFQLPDDIRQIQTMARKIVREELSR